MTFDHELGDALRERFAAAPQPPDSLLREVLDRLPQISQQRAARTGPTTVRFIAMFSATKLVVAGAMVALLGGFVLSGAVTRAPSQDQASGIGASASPTGSYQVAPGRYTIPWGDRDAVHVTVPAGWSRSPDGTSICKGDGPGACPQGSRIEFAVHDVARVARDVCSWDPAVPHQIFSDVGRTVGEITWVLAHQVGTQITAEDDITLSGHSAKSLLVTLATDACPDGPEGRLLWLDTAGPGFELLPGITGRIYVIDVGGLPLVITSSDRGASIDDLAQLDAIVASVDIELGISGLDAGRHPLSVADVPLSFSVPPRVAGGWDQFDRISINKSIFGPQGAEAMIYWASFPDGSNAKPCADLMGLPDDASASDVAAAMAAAAGTELISGPSDVSVGGRPAQHVVVRVRETFGCDPGFFYAWQDVPFGPLWSTTEVGDTLRAWVVDVGGTRLVIVGETHDGTSLDPTDARLTDEEAAGLDAEIRDIIDSIRFE